VSRCALLVAACLAVAPVALAEEPAGETRAFVEAVIPARPVYVHEATRLAVRVGVDRAFFEASAVPLFRQPLDLPVQVRAPWLEATPGAIPSADPPPAPAVTLALGDGVVGGRRAGEEVRDGRTFDVVEVARTVRFPEPGPVALSAPRLRFAYATSFREDFVGGRIGVDRHDVVVEGLAATIDVRPLPEAGRPAVFVDAVGRFTVRAARVATDDDEPLRIRLVIEGAGNLEDLTPPAVVDGFHVYGITSQRDDGTRSVTYDLAPLDEAVRAVPPIAFAWFDPDAEAYREAKTAAIPLDGRTPADVAPIEPAPPETGNDDEPEDPAWLRILLGTVAGGLAGIAAGLLVVFWRRRRKPSVIARASPTEPAAGPAPRVTASDVAAADPHEVGHVFAAFLASRLGRPAPSVIGPGLAARLGSAGLPDDLAREADDLLERLVASRYGGAPVEDPTGTAARVAEAIERARS
jgi:hypothetical protein